MSLKVLANRVLDRDNSRDTERDSLSHPASSETGEVGQEYRPVPRLETNQIEYEERAAIIEYDGKIPRDWAEGYARLCTMQRPENVSEARWQQVLLHAGRFIDRWAASTSALGWSTLDIFGVDRMRPEGDEHMAGLIWQLHDKDIVAISEDAIVVEIHGGARRSFRPHLDTANIARRVPLWEMGDG